MDSEFFVIEQESIGSKKQIEIDFVEPIQKQKQDDENQINNWISEGNPNCWED